MMNKKLLAWLSSAIVVVAILFAVILANIVGNRTRTRIDLSFTRTHQLSPRTLQVLNNLEPGYQIVLAIDRSSIDRQTYDAVADLLAMLHDSAPSLSVRTIDVGSTQGRIQFQSVVADLRERDRPTIEAQAATIAKTLDNLAISADSFRQAREQINALSAAVPTQRPDAREIHAFFSQRAALMGLLADNLDEVVSSMRKALDSGGDFLPDTPTIADRIRPELEKIDTQLAPIVTQFGQFAASQSLPEPLKPGTGALARSLGQVRDALLIEADTLSRFDRPSVFRARAALEKGQACLVIGPGNTGLNAIERDTLFPPGGGLGAAGVRAPSEIARRAEDLIAIALSSLASNDQPILVMLHAEVEPFIMSTPAFEQFVERHRQRGIDVVEWSLLTHPDPPALESLDPSGTRPVVYFVIAPNSAAAGVGGNEDLAGARRATRLGAELTRLLERGDSVLVCVNPSVFPTFGDPDPIAQALEPFGLIPRTGSPLIFEQPDQQGNPHILTAVDARISESPSALTRSISGLATRLIWPIVIDSQPTRGVTTDPILTVPGGDDRWMESQWIGLWQSASVPGQSVLAAYDEDRDAKRTEYIVARSAQRPDPDGSGLQRVLCVGSNAWALDRIAQEQITVDGNLVPSHPGNLELIDSSVYWLAGQDDQIAQGAATASAPMIVAIDPVLRGRIMWLLVAGLPIATLAAGVFYRMLRG